MKTLIQSALVFLLSFFLISNAFTQQGNIWYFGYKAGLNFNTPKPEILTNSALMTDEGCATIADINGKLRFYTDGTTVYNNQHKAMPNGKDLKGDPSTSNSAIIIPKPGSNDIFYIFTADACENLNAKGYNYSEVDMTLNGGLGDVTSNKNVPLYAPSTEKLTAIRDANGIDIWVVTKAWGNNEWVVYKVNCNGINPVPVRSRAGSVCDEIYIYMIGGEPHPQSIGSIGCIKASPDGKRIATVNMTLADWEILDFDNATGVVSNAIKVQQYGNAYGIEFSPDGKLVYVSAEWYGPGWGYIFQYDISKSDSVSIANSATLIGDGGDSVHIGALQLGPDNKIYCAMEMKSKLSVITSPNLKGLQCGFAGNKIDLKGRECRRGLPVFFPSLLINQNASIKTDISLNCATVDFHGNTAIEGDLLWQWDFGDGSLGLGKDVTHTYTGTATSYNIKLTVNAKDKCGGIAVAARQINLNKIIPGTAFTLSNQCGNYTVKFFDSSTIDSGGVINSYHWDFGDGSTSDIASPSHTYNSTGNYTVTLKTGDTRACGGYGSAVKTVAIETKPTADFSNTISCLNKSIQFNRKSTIGDGKINRWLWDFGDGASSTSENPIHTYTVARTYTVKFIAASETGCLSDTLVRQMVVTSIPKAAFKHAGKCISDDFVFQNNSSITGGSINFFNWLFGDGNSSKEENPRHNYREAGNYNASLYVVSQSGCISDTIETNIEVHSNPTVVFNFNNPGCGINEVQFTDASISQNETIASWHWNFGDNNNSLEKSPRHQYKAFNSYNVALFVLSSAGCSSDTLHQQVELKPKPLPDFIANNGCVGKLITFNNQSSIENGIIEKWHWDFGDGSKSIDSSVSHTYPHPGSYIATLLAVSDKDCVSDTIKKNITIETFPISNITVKDGCEKSIISIQNNSSIDNGTIQTHYWNFGDGGISGNAIPAHAYQNAGNYIIAYYVVSTNGCVSNTQKVPINIESIPVVKFLYDSACLGKPVHFTNKTSNIAGMISSYEWNFGDGSKSTAFDPSHIYTKYDLYKASLKAITTNGCMGESSNTVNILKVNINAGNDTIASIGQPIQLLATGAQEYEWTPSFSLSNPYIYNPVATIQQNIVYYLKGVTEEGCIGFDSLKITVYKGPEIYVPGAFTPNHDGKNDLLKPIIPGAAQLEYFIIYNRWGQKIFGTKTIGAGWDGKLNGIDQLPGTYVWMAKVKTYTGSTIERKGTIVLLR